MKKTVYSFFLLLLLSVFLVSCSLPPVTPVTRKELMRTRIYSQFVIEESPEELLYALNTRGEVIVEGYRKGYEQRFPVYVKLLATSGGLELLDYDR